MDYEAAITTDKEFYKSLEKLDQQLNVIYPLVLIAFGTCGNLITFYVYTRKYFKNTSFGFYYSCLGKKQKILNLMRFWDFIILFVIKDIFCKHFIALVDTLALCIGSLKFYLNAIDYINLTTYSTLTCKFFTSSIYILAQFSAWIIVLTNVDRLISVISPHVPVMTGYSRSRKFQYISVAFVGLVILALNIPNIIYLHISKEYLLDVNNSFELVLTCELGNRTYYNNNIADIMDLFIFSLIPFLIMIVSSLIISVTVFRSRLKLKKKYRNISGSNLSCLTDADSKRKKKKNLQFSFTILGTNLLFLILNLPICLILLIRNFKRQDDYFYESRVKLDLAFTVANILAYFNFSNSIIIHFFFNRLFRNRLKDICCKKKSNTMTSNTIRRESRRDSRRESRNITFTIW